MYFKKGLLYFVLFVILISLTGCSEKKTVEIPALIVISNETIPERVKKDLFEENIQKQLDTVLKENNKMKQEEKDNYIDVLSDVYALDEEREEYVANRKVKEEKKADLLNIFLETGYIPLFSDPRAENLVSILTEWTEIACLTPQNNPKEVKALDADGNNQTYQWHKIKADGKEGWIPSEYLLFKAFKETEAIVIGDIRIFSVPDCKAMRSLGICNRGAKITLTGYEYMQRNCSEKNIMRYSFKTYNESGWGYEPYILVDAHIGIILSDEVTLYKAPDDMKENVVKNTVYKKMEIVPIVDILENEWYKVVYNKKDVSFFIKNGNEVITTKKDDITYASYIREHYGPAKAIIEEVFKALESDPVQGVAQIAEKQNKIDKLEVIYNEIEEKQNEYPDSIFSGIGPYSLREFVQNLMIAKDALENVLPAIEEEQPADEESAPVEEEEKEEDDAEAEAEVEVEPGG